MAEYIVLQENGNGAYQEVARVDAGAPDIAIERVAQSEGSYVAVPLTRFDVVRVAPVRSLQVVREET